MNGLEAWPLPSPPAGILTTGTPSPADWSCYPGPSGAQPWTKLDEVWGGGGRCLPAGPGRQREEVWGWRGGPQHTGKQRRLGEKHVLALYRTLSPGAPINPQDKRDYSNFTKQKTMPPRGKAPRSRSGQVCGARINAQLCDGCASPHPTQPPATARKGSSFGPSSKCFPLSRFAPAQWKPGGVAHRPPQHQEGSPPGEEDV